MKYTENINLKKPDITDNVKISDINENMDIVDGKINGLEEKVRSQTVLETISQDLSGAVNELHLEVDDLAREVNSPLYQTVSSSSDVISLPDDGVEGQVSVTVKGNTRINIAKDITENIIFAGTGATDTGDYIKIGDDTNNTFRKIGEYKVKPSTIYTAQVVAKGESSEGNDVSL